MINRLFRWNKAVPTVMLGMAFFFMSCQPSITAKGKLRYAKLASALHDTAKEYFNNEQYREALGILRRISDEYPDYGDSSVVRYQMASSLYYLGQFRASKEEALRWLETYPRHSLKRDVMLLLGENYKALGDDAEAFRWWLKAKEEYIDDLPMQADLSGKLEELIESSDVEELERLAGYAAGSDYAPIVYHMLADIFLEQGELEKARKAAMSLVRSTSEQYWVSLGRELLESIHEQMSGRKGVVGCLLPLSGPFAIYGEEVLNGIQLGMEMFREPEQSPVVELVIRDTGGKPEKALAGLNDMVHHEKVMAVIGPLSSRVAFPVAKKAQGLGIPIITLTQKEGVTNQGEMIFRNFLTPSREVERLVNMTIDEMGIKRFAILYPDNSYGVFFMNLFWDRLDEKGGVVTAVESYKPEQTDFAGQIKKMIGLYHPRPESLVRKLKEMRHPEEEECRIFTEKPEPIIDFDAVFIPDNFDRVAMIAPQLVYYDVIYVLLMGTSLWQSPQLIEMAGDYVQGAVFPSGFFERSGESGVTAFSRDYKADFDCAPGLLAATGYDTIRLLKKVMAGEDIRTRKDIQRALLVCQDFPGVTGRISFDSRGEVVKEPFLLTISRGHMTLFR